MIKTIWSALLLAFVASAPSIQAQNSAPAKPGAAIIIPDAELQGKLKEMIAAKLQDEAVRVVSLNGESNLGVFIIHLNPGELPKDPVSLSTHDDVSEVYYIIKGEGMLYHGGTLDNAETRVSERTGPGRSGTVKGPLAQKVGAGDVFIVPSNTPHQVNLGAKTEMVYLVVRIDGQKHLKLK